MRCLRNFPGDDGFDETVDYLRERVVTNEAIPAAEDIGSAVKKDRSRYSPTSERRRRGDDGVRRNQLRRSQNRVDDSFLVFPAAEPVIEEYMDVEARIGDFIIYRATDD